MPHIIVKLFPGRSEEQKARLTEKITQDVIEVLNSADKSISVAIEEVAADKWTEKVYRPDIEAKWDQLYKQPGYKP